MEIETAKKTAELYKQLEALKHKSYVEAVYLARAQQEVRDHQANFNETESEIKKISREIADLN